MISFPNAKINIGLNILSKRQDGYHNLQTILYPVCLRDALEIVDAQENQNDLSFSSSGLDVSGPAADNLCIKAFRVLQKDFPQLMPLRIHLHKVIPMGAGMGGGSSDATFMLSMLNEKFALGLKEDALMRYALQLGSDCPFFIRNEPCLATGRGEILIPVILDLSSYNILIINPGIHVTTATAFSWIQPAKNSPDLQALAALPIDQWKEYIFNDFEGPVFKEFPAIAQIKETMYINGALYASMSGSGSSVYGIFQPGTRPEVPVSPGYFSHWV